MTREGKAVTGVLCVFIIMAIIVAQKDAVTKETAANPTNSTQVAIAEDKNTEEISPATETAENFEINGLKTLSKDVKIKNPFTFSHETRDFKSPEIEPEEKENIEITEEKNDTSAKKQPPRTVSDNKPEKPAQNWKLTGVVIVGDDKTAILSKENENRNVMAGEVFDDKIITDIGDDYIVYADSAGQKRLELSPSP